MSRAIGEDCELLYFADPMCSWCWGFAPVAARIDARFGARAPLSVVVGGLHTCTQHPLDAAAKEKIRAHWERVHASTGQPFDFAFFEREPFVYDTEPSCRAVVAARRLAPGRERDMLERLHQAFYAENRDVTDADVLIALGAELLAVSRETFREAYESEAAELETYADFALARELGVKCFPTLVARRDEELAVLSQGYQAAECVEKALAAWLDPA